MIVTRFTIQACCGKTALIFKTDTPLSTNLLNYFISNGYVESKHFTVAGVLYVSNQNLIITGAFGGNKLQVKCKKKDCNEILNNLETLLLNA